MAARSSYRQGDTLEHFDLQDYESFPGGLEVSLPPELGLALNAWLRVPVRILLRFAEKEVVEKQELVAADVVDESFVRLTRCRIMLVICMVTLPVTFWRPVRASRLSISIPIICKLPLMTV